MHSGIPDLPARLDAAAPNTAHTSGAPLRALKRASQLASIGLLMMVASCASETLFQSSFNASPVGAPPPQVQATGTISVGGAPGSVTIVGPVPGTTENWVQVQRSSEQAPISEMRCDFSASRGDGTYSLLCSLFIPSGSGLATVEFATSPFGSPQSAGFLHLDFLQDNTVRLDDDAGEVFGTFPRDQFFALAVTLEVGASSAVAHISLFGTGASGSKDHDVTPLSLAHQVGAVKFWMGFPWTGSFDVTDIHVSYKAP